MDANYYLFKIWLFASFISGLHLIFLLACSKSGNRNGGKQKHGLCVDNALVPKKKREDLVKEERLLEADHCMIEEVKLEQNDQNKKPTSNKCVILFL